MVGPQQIFGSWLFLSGWQNQVFGNCLYGIFGDALLPIHVRGVYIVVVNATVPFVHNVKYDSCDWNERSMCVLYLSYVYEQVIGLLANRELNFTSKTVFISPTSKIHVAILLFPFQCQKI